VIPLPQTQSTSHFATRPLAATFGVEIVGIDLPTASVDQLQSFDDVCRQNSLVVVRRQTLSPAQLIAVADRFGSVSPQRRVGPHPEYPGISILSNKVENGKPIGVHESGRAWHSDGTTYPTLGLTTLLYGVELPAEGGDTLWADSRAAFEALPADRQKELESMQTVHNRGLLFERANGPAITPEERASMHDIVHPMVVDNPIGDGKALFLTRGSLKGVVGMSPEDGRGLVSELIGHVTQEQWVYRHKWQDGDLVIWNNLCTMHSATEFDDSRYDRVVYRVWVRPTTPAWTTQ
jgi:taurine dioxygenase